MTVISQINGKKYIVLVIFVLLGFLPLLPYIRSSGEMAHCIFCDIAGGEVPKTKIEVETDEFVIFKDINPSSTYHYLAVPKRHIESVKVLTKEDDALVAQMEAGLKKFFTSQNINTKDAIFGFHLPPFITVKHLHMHGIAPRSTMTFFNRLIFRTGSVWFKTAEETREMLKQKA